MESSKQVVHYPIYTDKKSKFYRFDIVIVFGMAA
jgi:hypothetical protein